MGIIGQLPNKPRGVPRVDDRGVPMAFLVCDQVPVRDLPEAAARTRTATLASSLAAVSVWTDHGSWHLASLRWQMIDTPIVLGPTRPACVQQTHDMGLGAD